VGTGDQEWSLQNYLKENKAILYNKALQFSFFALLKLAELTCDQASLPFLQQEVPPCQKKRRDA